MTNRRRRGCRCDGHRYGGRRCGRRRCRDCRRRAGGRRGWRVRGGVSVHRPGVDLAQERERGQRGGLQRQPREQHQDHELAERTLHLRGEVYARPPRPSAGRPRASQEVLYGADQKNTRKPMSTWLNGHGRGAGGGTGRTPDAGPLAAAPGSRRPAAPVGACGPACTSADGSCSGRGARDRASRGRGRRRGPPASGRPISRVAAPRVLNARFIAVSFAQRDGARLSRQM